MDSAVICRKFLEFFEKNRHKIVKSSSLLPDDPSVLLTTAGMQQFKQYYANPEIADRELQQRLVRAGAAAAGWPGCDPTPAAARV